MKTKLGISCGLLAAAMYFAALFDWTTAAVLIAGYILIAEQDRLLKTAAIKALAVTMGFALLKLFVGFIPDAISLIDKTMEIFEKDFSLSVVSRIVTWINLVISICENVVLLILAFAAFKQKNITLPVIDKLIQQHFPFEGGFQPAPAPVPPASADTQSPVNPVQQSVPQQPTQQASTKFCPRCGKQLNAAAGFCSNCGNKV